MGNFGGGGGPGGGGAAQTDQTLPKVNRTL